MKKEIFQLFTIENGILLSNQALEYISTNFSDINSLEKLLKSCKLKFNSSSISLEQIKEIVSQKTAEQNLIEIKTFKYHPRELLKDFTKISGTINLNITPISILQEDVEEIIFGLFYKNSNGKYLLEDDHNLIEIDLKNVKNDVFLFENMFVGLKGVKQECFKVNEIILPPLNVHSLLSDPKIYKNSKICVFGCYNSEESIIKRAILTESPDFCIISTKNEIDLSNLKDLCPNLIQCPSRQSCKYIPVSSNNISNPFLFEIFNNLVGFIDFNLFDYRKDGLFLNNKPIESFLRSVFSQGTICPFSGSDFSIPEIPNVLIISQDFHPLVLKVEGITFMSLPPVGENSYALLDFENDIYEVKYINSNI